MKRFDAFGEYMFDLLFAPLKKGRRVVNQFSIFFRVVGREFDDLKAVLLRVRDEANVASASEVMLPVHGQNRDMPRLEGEDAEGYRTRLSMKGIISKWSGTRQGVLYVLAALGYEQSHIEPVYEQDPEHWAEFIIFLKRRKQSGVNNLAVIDAEIRKVKEDSSRPFYGTESGNTILLLSRLERGVSDYPRCNQIVCGVWPHVTSIGCLLKSDIVIGDRTESGDVAFPQIGAFAVSQRYYCFGESTIYKELASELAAGSKAQQGVKEYLRCSRLSRCSSTIHSIRTMVNGSDVRVYIYFNDTVIGDVANMELVDKDGDVVAKADDRVFTKTPGKGLYVAFQYNIKEMEAESGDGVL